MAINDVSLTSGMKANLVSLQGTTGLLDRTQQRLASGRKVNSALDNPTSFFAAQSLTQRASDLSGLKDSMLNAISTIQSANNGISGISALIAAAKGLAQSALSTSDTTVIDSYAQQYDSILDQITQMAGDSSYSGTNFLASQNLTVKFDDASGSTLQISGFDATSSGLGISKAISASSTASVSPSPDATYAGTTAISGTVGQIMNGTVTDPSWSSPAVVNDYTAHPGNYRVVSASAVAIITPDFQALVVSGTFTNGDPFMVESYTNGVNQTTGAPNPVTITTPGGNSWRNPGGIQTSLTQLGNATTTLNTHSASLMSNLSVVTTRQHFTVDIINDLQAGADDLTLADMNQEGANMLMLQTRESLGTTALGLSSQAAQSVLKLF